MLTDCGLSDIPASNWEAAISSQGTIRIQNEKPIELPHVAPSYAHDVVIVDMNDGSLEPLVDRLIGITAVDSVSQSGLWPPSLPCSVILFLIICEHLIAYAQEKNPLWVHSVLHARCSPRTNSAIPTGRE
jgi:hypothetical protein